MGQWSYHLTYAYTISNGAIRRPARDCSSPELRSQVIGVSPLLNAQPSLSVGRARRPVGLVEALFSLSAGHCDIYVGRSSDIFFIQRHSGSTDVHWCDAVLRRWSYRGGAPTPTVQIQPKQGKACDDENDRQRVQKKRDHTNSKNVLWLSQKSYGEL